jgi:hypothetical protein
MTIEETNMRSKTLAGVAFGALFLALLTACGGSQPEPADPVAQQPEGAELPAGHPPAGQVDPGSVMPTPVMSEGAALTWTMPADWINEPPSNVMRQSQYRVPGPAGDGQCVVYYFGAGQGGGPEANAERWADQFEQPEGRSSREVLVTEQAEASGMPVLMVEVTGTYKEGGMMMTGGPETTYPNYMLRAAIVQGPDANWFFKFTGPAETVQANTEQFQALVDSIQGSA